MYVRCDCGVECSWIGCRAQVAPLLHVLLIKRAQKSSAYATGSYSDFAQIYRNSYGSSDGTGGVVPTFGGMYPLGEQ